MEHRRTCGNAVHRGGRWPAKQHFALGWLVFRLPNSPFLLKPLGFFGQVPAFLLAPLGGAFADLTDPRKVLIIIQTLAMVARIRVRLPFVIVEDS